MQAGLVACSLGRRRGPYDRGDLRASHLACGPRLREVRQYRENRKDTKRDLQVDLAEAAGFTQAFLNWSPIEGLSTVTFLEKSRE